MKKIIFLIITLISFNIIAQDYLINLPDDLVQKVLSAEKYVFDLEYEQAGFICKEINKKYPKSPIGNLCFLIIFESQMVDNDDFYLDDVFNAYLKRAEKITKKIETKKYFWTKLFAGAFYGIKGLHYLRKHENIEALKVGYHGVELLKEAHKLDPKKFDALLGLGIYNYYSDTLSSKTWWFPFQIGNRDVGFDQLRSSTNMSLMAKDPSRLMLAYLYFCEEKYKQAEIHFNLIKEKYPKNLISRLMLGRIYLAQNELDKAEVYINEALKIDPQKYKAHAIMAQIKITKKDYQSAKNYYDLSLKLSKSNERRAESLIGIARCYAAIEDNVNKNKYISMAKDENKEIKIDF
ncbi:MAG: tetratricopeptide repeat protein [Pseudomonadota bacterium]